jgi:hypothetical protein
LYHLVILFCGNFERDTHFRIILGNFRAVGKQALSQAL